MDSKHYIQAISLNPGKGFTRAPYPLLFATRIDMARPVFSLCREVPSTFPRLTLRRRRSQLEKQPPNRGHNLNTKLMAATAALFIFSAQAIAQTQSARLVGTIQDQSGAAIPNAKITAVDDATRHATEATTNTSGEYVLPSLQPGAYNLTVEAAGFRKAVVNGLQLDAAANMSQNVTLEVGQVTEVLEVKANAVSVQTTDTQINQSVTLSDIATLPQLGRTPLTLAIFQPGVQINTQANGSSSGADYSFAHVNGLRQGSNNNTLDGIDVNDSVTPRIGLSLTANNTDSVEEARIVTDGGKAEYGRSAGAQIQLITRSGTNQFHGNAFDYLRNRDLNANDFFDNGAGVPIPVLIQNNYGGSFGGPIKRNKIFFFGNYQGIRTHAQGVQNTTVPTASAKAGIFEWLPAGGTVQQYSIVNNDPLHKGIDPTVASLLSLFPAPNNNNVGDGLNSAGYQFNFPNGSLSDQFTIKVDYNFSDKIHLQTIATFGLACCSRRCILRLAALWILYGSFSTTLDVFIRGRRTRADKDRHLHSG